MTVLKKLIRFIPFVLLSLTMITACQTKHRQFSSTDISGVTHHATARKGWRADGRNSGGYTRTNFLKSSKVLITALMSEDVQVINEGHRVTVIIPTDKYFVFNTAKLNDLRFETFENILTLIKCFPETDIYVAGFTDEIGSKAHKRRLSQDRAQAMVAFLWASGFPHSKLHAEGYLDKFPIGNNRLIHASSYNRRIELQWAT